MLGLAASLAKGGASLLTYVKDNLKLYLDFKSNRSDELKFPSEGSTSFDGVDDYIDCGNDSSLQFSGSFSVGCWFKTTDATSSNEIFVSKNNDGVNQGWLVRLNSSRKLEFGVLSGVITDSGSASNDGNWHHVVAVHESGVGNKLYKDGALVASNTTGTDLTEHVPNFHIANQDYSTARAINADICNVFAYSRVLSLEEINSVMNKSYSQLGSVEKTSLVSWWALDNASNGVVQPATGEVLGNELIPDGEFTDESLWDAGSDTAIGTGISFVNGQAIWDTSGTIELKQDITINSGKLYKVVLDIDSVTSGTIRNNVGSYGGTFNTAGIKTEYITGTGSRFYLVGFSGFDGALNSVSVKEVLSNTGVVTGATTTTSVYGNNSPVLPRAIDIAESFADAIGDGSALFNGSSDYVSISDNNLFSMGNGSNDNKFSITAWINMNDATDFIIASKGVYNSNGEFSFETDASDRLRLVLMDESVVNTYEIAYSGAITSYQNEWIHVACTYNGVGGASANGGIKLYINGINQSVSLLDSGTHVSLENLGGDLFIGKYDSNYSDGKISQLGIWKGELSQAQIQSVMESTSYAKIPADVKSTLGSELVTSITNSSSNPWETFSGASGNTLASATNDAGTSGEMFSQQLGLSANTLVKVTVTVTLNVGTINVQFCATDGSYTSGDLNETISSSGTHSFYTIISHADKDSLWVKYATTPNDISNLTLSVKEVTNDLVAYYPLDADSSVKALSFDGSGDTVTFTEQSFALEFTTSFWIIFDDVTANYKTVITGSQSPTVADPSQNGSNDIIMKDNDGQLYIRIASEYSASAQTLASNTWYHIAYTRDSDNLVTAYVNGSSTNTHTEPGTFNVSTIGGSAVHKQTSFAMYNKCKTASEILSIYNDGIDGDESSNSDLTLYYKLDNASTVTDLSSTGTNGSVSNATLIENAVALDSTSNNNDGSLI